MKEQIKKYFDNTDNGAKLQDLRCLDEVQYTDGLDVIINDLSIKIQDTLDQSLMLVPGTDPLSRVLSAEILDMRDYLWEDLFKNNRDDFLLVQYFCEACALSQSPVDTDDFVLKDIIARFMFKPQQNALKT